MKIDENNVAAVVSDKSLSEFITAPVTFGYRIHFNKKQQEEL